MVNDTTGSTGCPFCAILRGEEPGNIIARDDDQGFALIQSIHPESTIHWMAVPLEHVESTEQLAQTNRRRFLDLVDFAIQQAKAQTADYPALERGFTIKMHFGSFESIAHAKLHVLVVE